MIHFASPTLQYRSIPALCLFFQLPRPPSEKKKAEKGYVEELDATVWVRLLHVSIGVFWRYWHVQTFVTFFLLTINVKCVWLHTGTAHIGVTC